MFLLATSMAPAFACKAFKPIENPLDMSLLS